MPSHGEHVDVMADLHSKVRLQHPDAIEEGANSYVPTQSLPPSHHWRQAALCHLPRPSLCPSHSSPWLVRSFPLLLNSLNLRWLARICGYPIVSYSVMSYDIRRWDCLHL